MSDYEKRCILCEGKVETEGADKCNFCLSMDEKYKDNKGPIKEKKPKIKEDIKYAEVICTGCNKIVKIRTSDPTTYTEEVRKTWKCLLCANPGTNKWQL